MLHGALLSTIYSRLLTFSGGGVEGREGWGWGWGWGVGCILGHNSSHKMQRPNQEGAGDKGEGVRELGRGQRELGEGGK